MSFAATAQLRLTVNAGYGTYSQAELSNLQQQMENNLDNNYEVDTKITAAFPAWLYINGSVGYLITKQLAIGSSVAWGSSGGRISYNDYSGSVTLDMLVSYTSIGIPVTIIIKPDSKWLLALELVPSYVFNKMNFNFEYVLLDDADGTKLKFRSRNIAVQPGLVLSRHIGRLGFDLRAGYNLTLLKGNLFLEGGDGTYLLDDNDQKVRMDWNGLRLEAGLSWTFKRSLER
jgi:hypothetical protein